MFKGRFVEKQIEAYKSDNIDGRDSPKPVRSMVGQDQIGAERGIDVESVISTR